MPKRMRNSRKSPAKIHPLAPSGDLIRLNPPWSPYREGSSARRGWRIWRSGGFRDGRDRDENNLLRADRCSFNKRASFLLIQTDAGGGGTLKAADRGRKVRCARVASNSASARMEHLAFAVEGTAVSSGIARAPIISIIPACSMTTRRHPRWKARAYPLAQLNVLSPPTRAPSSFARASPSFSLRLYTDTYPRRPAVSSALARFRAGRIRFNHITS